jgi:Sec-independent protein translocase protein TatA
MRELKVEITRILGLLLDGSLELSGAISKILDLISEYEVKEDKEEMNNEEEKKEEETIEYSKKNEEDNNKEDKEEEDKEEVKNSDNQVIEAMLFPKDELIEIDKKALENYFNTQKELGIKIPVYYEHLNPLNSEVIDIIEKEDGYYAKILLKDDIKDTPYLSAGIDVIQDENEELAILKEISFTSKPKKNVKKIELPEYVYSNFPRLLRKIIYSLPRNEKIFKKLSYLPPKKVENKSLINIDEKEIRRSLRMI